MQTIFRSGIIVIAIVFSSIVLAEESCPPVIDAQLSNEQIKEAMSNAQDRGFLWRISKEGRTSFLYGTIHVAKPEWLFPGPTVMDAIRNSDTVALELDMSDADISRRISRGMVEMHSEVLPESLVRRLHQQADAVCVPYESMIDLSAELQVVLLSVFVGRWEALDAEFGIDNVLGGIGHGAAKDVVSLETPERQLQMLQMPSRQETIAFVEDGLKDLESGRARTMLSKIAKLWSEGDFAEMSRYSEWCECLDSEIDRIMMKRLLDERNTDLSRSIDALHLSGKNVFAAVGSLHLFGPFGLPALMGQLGYQVQRVKHNDTLY